MRQPDTDNVQNEGKSALYEQFAGTILAYLCQQVSNRQDAEDLLLEVFLAAHQHTLLTMLPAERQLAWLRRVARNKVIDHYRHAALFTMQPLEQAEETEDERLTPEQRAEARENSSCLAQALAQLAPEQQELVRLRYVQELPFAQIAELLGKSEGTVRKMLSRTLRRLRTLYERSERGM
jgi:RNA polymerase sigma factor (sigma-70 family)